MYLRLQDQVHTSEYLDPIRGNIGVNTVGMSFAYKSLSEVLILAL